MRFHHSTRRGRNRLNQHHLSGHNSLGVAGHRALHHSNTSTSRWSQLAFCRDTNIHFNRRLPVEPPLSLCLPPLPSHGGKNSLGLCDSDAQVFEFMLKTGTKKQSEDDLKLGQLSLADSNSHEVEKVRKKEESKKSGSMRNRESIIIKQPSKLEPWPASGSTIDMETARAKLVAQVEKHPFWSSKAARRMQLTALDERRIFIYELISFCERRDLEWRFEPYKGGLVSAVPFRRLPSPATTPTSNHSKHQLPLQAKLDREQAPLTESVKLFDFNAALNNKHSNSTAPNSHANLHRSSTPPAQLNRLSAPQSSDSFWPRSSISSSSHRLRTQTVSTRPPSSSMRRSFSSGSNRSSQTTTAAPQTPNSACLLYEPVSAIEHRQTPSREFVWSMEVRRGELRPEAFVGHVHTQELPNSSFVKRCHGCQGKGRLKCASCYGVGYEVCISCSGKGTTKSLSSSLSSSMGRSSNRYTSSSESYNSRNSIYANGYDQDSDYYGQDSGSGGHKRGYEPGGISGGSSGGSGSAWVTESCHFCHGAGQKRCWVCAGKSYNHCLGCLGSGQLRCYLNLNITWLNHRDEVVLNNADNIIPRDRLRLCNGLLLVDEVADRLGALQETRIDGAVVVTNSPNHNPARQVDESNQLHQASKRLLEKHNQTYKQERLIKQRHKVTQIGAHVVHYEWKQRRGHFVIYGDEKKVYIAKYPFKSFCNIT